MLNVGPGAQAPRAVAHVRAISAHTQRAVVFISEEPLPGGINCVSICTVTTVSRRTPSELAKRLFNVAKALIVALEDARNSHSHIAAIVINVPPALPTIAVTRLWMTFRASGAKLIIDWHNTSHSILASNNASSRIVAIARFVERYSATLAHSHWCVSAALKQYLFTYANINANVVRDTPPQHFRPDAHRRDSRTTHELLHRVAKAAGKSFPAAQTALTCANGTRWRSDSVRLLVSSTSWTPDEDFSILFAALRSLDQRLCAFDDADSETQSNLRLLVVITGQGPTRARFEDRVKNAAFRAVRVWCVWLHRADYPRLLSIADLGVSLHASSSGYDLPMKVVDMFGCGLPVVALRYPCLGELVRDGENGLLFSDAEELARLLHCTLFDKSGARRLDALRRAAVAMYPAHKRWTHSWQTEALPSFLELIGDDRNK